MSGLLQSTRQRLARLPTCVTAGPQTDGRTAVRPRSLAPRLGAPAGHGPPAHGHQGTKEAAHDTAALGRRGVYSLRFLGARFQCQNKTKQNKETKIQTKDNWDNNYKFLETLSTTFSHFFIFYILTKLFF